MEAKIELARSIVTDFHSAADAARAAEEFNRVVRRGEIPADIQTVPLPEGVRNATGIRVDKMLARIGLAESVSDATRKIKAGAVEINGERVRGPGAAGRHRRADRAIGEKLAQGAGLVGIVLLGFDLFACRDDFAGQALSRLSACGGLSGRPSGGGLRARRSSRSCPTWLCCYFALSRFANRRYAPGTPAGNWRNQEYAVKM